MHTMTLPWHFVFVWQFIFLRISHSIKIHIYSTKTAAEKSKHSFTMCSVLIRFHHICRLYLILLEHVCEGHCWQSQVIRAIIAASCGYSPNDTAPLTLRVWSSRTSVNFGSNKTLTNHLTGIFANIPFPNYSVKRETIKADQIINIITRNFTVGKITTKNDGANYT